MNDESRILNVRDSQSAMRTSPAFFIRASTSGFTLIELLVVLIIMAILASVTLRAMDITRERTNYEKTMGTLQRLTIAIVGDPTLIAEGRRTDFGFVGDLGRLPTSLDELASNISGNSNWNGPYARIPFVGDSVSFKTDAWGNEFQYLEEQAELVSQGNGSSPITYSITDDTAFLFWNQVSGTITDNQGEVPGDQAPTIRVSLWVPDPQTGLQDRYDTVPGSDGSYVFDPSHFRIPAGNHEMMVKFNAGSESLTKWVMVSPRVGAIVDFRTSSNLGGALRLSGKPLATVDSGSTASSVLFSVINTSGDTLHAITLDAVTLSNTGAPVYCNRLKLGPDTTAEIWNWNNSTRAGDTASGGSRMTWTTPPAPAESVPAYSTMLVKLDSFYSFPTPSASDNLIDMNNITLQLKFSDGSLISFTVH